MRLGATCGLGSAGDEDVAELVARARLHLQVHRGLVCRHVHPRLATYLRLRVPQLAQPPLDQILHALPVLLLEDVPGFSGSSARARCWWSSGSCSMPVTLTVAMRVGSPSRTWPPGSTASLPSGFTSLADDLGLVEALVPGSSARCAAGPPATHWDRSRRAPLSNGHSGSHQGVFVVRIFALMSPSSPDRCLRSSRSSTSLCIRPWLRGGARADQRQEQEGSKVPGSKEGCVHGDMFISIPPRIDSSAVLH